MPPIPLELLACELVLGVHPASETSNLKKGVNTYIYIYIYKWMKLNTNDGNKIKLWILLFTDEHTVASIEHTFFGSESDDGDCRASILYEPGQMGLHVACARSPGRRPFGLGWWHQPGPIGIHASAFLCPLLCPCLVDATYYTYV